MIGKHKKRVDAKERVSRTCNFLLSAVKLDRIKVDGLDKDTIMLDALYSLIGVEAVCEDFFGIKYGGWFALSLGFNGRQNVRGSRYWSGNYWRFKAESAKKFKDREETEKYILENYERMIWR